MTNTHYTQIHVHYDNFGRTLTAIWAKYQIILYLFNMPPLTKSVYGIMVNLILTCVCEWISRNIIEVQLEVFAGLFVLLGYLYCSLIQLHNIMKISKNMIMLYIVHVYVFKCDK